MKREISWWVGRAISKRKPKADTPPRRKKIDEIIEHWDNFNNFYQEVLTRANLYRQESTLQHEHFIPALKEVGKRAFTYSSNSNWRRVGEFTEWVSDDSWYNGRVPRIHASQQNLWSLVFVCCDWQTSRLPTFGSWTLKLGDLQSSYHFDYESDHSTSQYQPHFESDKEQYHSWHLWQWYCLSFRISYRHCRVHWSLAQEA